MFFPSRTWLGLRSEWNTLYRRLLRPWHGRARRTGYGDVSSVTDEKKPGAGPGFVIMTSGMAIAPG
jgi:hypothetical protein